MNKPIRQLFVAVAVIKSVCHALSFFAKSIPGGVCLNLSESAGIWCDDICIYKNPTDPSIPTCYATRIEGFRPGVKNRGRRNRLTVVQVINMATLELRQIRELGFYVPWFRFSAFGPVPKPAQAKAIRGFESAFQILINEIAEHVKLGCGFHFPVESVHKAKYYQQFLPEGMTVRESCQSERTALRRDRAISWVAGSPGMAKPDKISLAKAFIAKRLNKTGRRSVICPATMSRSNSKHKCGQCTACHHKQIDVVYLSH